MNPATEKHLIRQHTYWTALFCSGCTV